jgi:hypothetical protein
MASSMPMPTVAPVALLWAWALDGQGRGCGHWMDKGLGVNTGVGEGQGKKVSFFLKSCMSFIQVDWKKRREMSGEGDQEFHQAA